MAMGQRAGCQAKAGRGLCTARGYGDKARGEKTCTLAHIAASEVPSRYTGQITVATTPLPFYHGTKNTPNVNNTN